MATGSDTEAPGKGIAGKLLIPVAVSAVGSALGFLLTKRQKIREAAPKVRQAVSDLPRPTLPERGVGELTDELRGKVESVLGKEPAAGGEHAPARIDTAKFEQRRRARQERRNSRRRRSSSRR
jgi:hypothetical protein